MSLFPLLPFGTKLIEVMMEAILPKRGKYISQPFLSLIPELIEKHMNQYSLEYLVE